MKTVRVKSVVRNVVEKSDGSPQPFLGLEDLESRTGKLLVTHLPRKAAEDSICYTPGDVLFSKLRPYLAKSFLPCESGTGTGEFLVLRPGRSIDSRFLFYVTLSGPWIMWSNSTAYGTKMPRTSWELLGSYRLWLPPLQEQRRIADFLDAETARIDKMARLREQQLRLWGERARALAGSLIAPEDNTETRPLDWLGPVPAEWPTPSIGRISRFIMGTTFPHKYQGERSGDFPFIKVSDFQNADIIGRMEGAENWISAAVARELGARIVPPGAILYARVGAAVLLNRRRITTRPSVIDDNVRAISFSHGDPRFRAGILSLLDMGQLVNPGPVPSISESQVSPIRIPDPDASFQRKIADDLEKGLNQWQKARRLVERQLNLINERRQSLITAAVTGQFDVSTASGRGVDVT